MSTQAANENYKVQLMQHRMGLGLVAYGGVDRVLQRHSQGYLPMLRSLQRHTPSGRAVLPPGLLSMPYVMRLSSQRERAMSGSSERKQVSTEAAVPASSAQRSNYVSPAFAGSTGNEMSSADVPAVQVQQKRSSILNDRPALHERSDSSPLMVKMRRMAVGGQTISSATHNSEPAKNLPAVSGMALRVKSDVAGMQSDHQPPGPRAGIRGAEPIGVLETTNQPASPKSSGVYRHQTIPATRNSGNFVMRETRNIAKTLPIQAQRAYLPRVRVPAVASVRFDPTPYAPYRASNTSISLPLSANLARGTNMVGVSRGRGVVIARTPADAGMRMPNDSVVAGYDSAIRTSSRRAMTVDRPLARNMYTSRSPVDLPKYSAQPGAGFYLSTNQVQILRVASRAGTAGSGANPKAIDQIMTSYLQAQVSSDAVRGLDGEGRAQHMPHGTGAVVAESRRGTRPQLDTSTNILLRQHLALGHPPPHSVRASAAVADVHGGLPQYLPTTARGSASPVLEYVQRQPSSSAFNSEQLGAVAGSQRIDRTTNDRTNFTTANGSTIPETNGSTHGSTQSASDFVGRKTANDDLERIANEVYLIIERRITIERESLGL